MQQSKQENNVLNLFKFVHIKDQNNVNDVNDFYC